jgi:hypothetical protein
MTWHHRGGKRVVITAITIVVSASAIGGLGVREVSGAAPEQSQATRSRFVRHPLTGESADTIAQYALEYLRERALVVSGTPQVALVRTTTTAEMAALGWGRMSFTCGEPPLVLAVLRGDFDASRARMTKPPGAPPVRVDRIGYAFDANNGMAAVEVYGAVDLRRLLNDPTLPGLPVNPTMVPLPGTRGALPASSPGSPPARSPD